MDFLISEIKINFIDDNRYRYILKGLGNTLIIMTLALIIGIIIGFFVGIIRAVNEKEKNLNPFLKLLNKICVCYITIIRGTPVMLQLLIMYLGILAIPNFPTIIVASLTFGITRGGEIIRSNTFSIWTPLIAVASIYLLIVLILSKLIKLMEGALRKNEK